MQYAVSFEHRTQDFTPQDYVGDSCASTLQDNRGWVFSLKDPSGRDYIYPVNPALRFNGSQTLGAGYGDTAKQSLSHGRELRFLLDQSDYEAFEPYVDHALWPYNAAGPDHATDQYFGALENDGLEESVSANHA